MMSQLAAGVRYLHVEKGILHRDIKPGNVLVSPGPILKLCDFGLAKILSSDSQAMTNTIGVGSPPFMAPEVKKGGSYGREADIFSLGTPSPVFFEPKRPNSPFCRLSSSIGSIWIFSNPRLLTFISIIYLDRHYLPLHCAPRHGAHFVYSWRQVCAYNDLQLAVVGVFCEVHPFPLP